MCLDQIGLLVWLGLLLRFAEFLDQPHGLTLEATVEPTSGTGVDYIAELFRGEIEESDADWSIREICREWKPRGVILVQVDATIGEFAERSLLLELCVAND